MGRVHLPDYESIGLPKSIVGWIVNHATKNYWRVADWYELDDLIQDGLMIAYKCRERYGSPVEKCTKRPHLSDIDPAHFMALVKTAFYRHITEMLRHSRGEQAVTSRIGDVAGELDETAYLDRHAAPVEGDYDMAALLADMPETLRKALAVFVDRKKQCRIHLSGDESESSWLKRLAGFPMRHDFETELRAYLGHQA